MQVASRERDTTSSWTIVFDGGMSASHWTMQFFADILGAPVDRSQVLETTALGAAYLAGMQRDVTHILFNLEGGSIT